MTPLHAFVDESARPGRYLMCAVLVEGDRAGAVRRQMRSLLLPGQRRLHFQKESRRRRRELLSQLVEIDATVVVFDRRRLAPAGTAGDRFDRGNGLKKAANPAADRPDGSWVHFRRPWALGSPKYARTVARIKERPRLDECSSSGIEGQHQSRYTLTLPG